MDYRLETDKIVCSTDSRRKAICDHRSKGIAVKAMCVSQNPQGPAGCGGGESQQVASYSASLSL
jgi:hypothetical protein